MSTGEFNPFTCEWTSYTNHISTVPPKMNYMDLETLEMKALSLLSKNIETESVSFQKEGKEIGLLLDEKNKAYGNSFDKCADFIKLLYPNGIPNTIEAYTDMLCLVRIFDKMMRIATFKDAFNESPFSDIAGYAILGLRRHKKNSI